MVYSIVLAQNYGQFGFSNSPIISTRRGIGESDNCVNTILVIFGNYGSDFNIFILPKYSKYVILIWGMKIV